MIELKQKYDASTVAVMRQALNEVVTDRRFLVRKSVTPLEMAEHILQQAASGERDLGECTRARPARSPWVSFQPAPGVSGCQQKARPVSFEHWRKSRLPIHD